jgi:integrase
MARKGGKDRGVMEWPEASGKWWASYAGADGKMHREFGGKKSAARTLYELRKTQVREGRWFPAARRRAPLFDDLLRDYRKAKEREGKEVQRGEYGYRRLTDTFGGRRADAIAARDVEGFRDRLMETLAPASVVRHLTLLRAILNRAIRDGRLATLPTRGVNWPKENNKRVRCLADDEEARLMRKLSARLRPLVVLALNTGMRRGELLGLRWKDIDLVNRTITIREAKSGEGRRIPMNAQAYDTLSRARRERIRKGEAGAGLTAFRELAVFGPSAAAMVMALKRHFDSAVKAAKVEDFRFHDLRHTFASRLAMRNFNLPTIGELLGHKTLTMTARYAHLLPDHLKRAVAALDTRTLAPARRGVTRKRRRRS